MSQKVCFNNNGLWNSSLNNSGYNFITVAKSSDSGVRSLNPMKSCALDKVTPQVTVS